MKTHYRISKEPLTSIGDVARFKDFGRLVHDYERLTKPLYERPLYRDPRAFIVLLIILLITYLIVEADRRDRIDDGEPDGTEMVSP